MEHMMPAGVQEPPSIRRTKQQGAVKAGLKGLLKQAGFTVTAWRKRGGGTWTCLQAHFSLTRLQAHRTVTSSSQWTAPRQRPLWQTLEHGCGHSSSCLWHTLLQRSLASSEPDGPWDREKVRKQRIGSPVCRFMGISCPIDSCPPTAPLRQALPAHPNDGRSSMAGPVGSPEASSSWQTKVSWVFPQWQPRSRVSRQGSHGPGWHCRGQGWPHSLATPQGLLQVSQPASPRRWQGRVHEWFPHCRGAPHGASHENGDAVLQGMASDLWPPRQGTCGAHDTTLSQGGRKDLSPCRRHGFWDQAYPDRLHAWPTLSLMSPLAAPNLLQQDKSRRRMLRQPGAAERPTSSRLGGRGSCVGRYRGWTRIVASWGAAEMPTRQSCGAAQGARWAWPIMTPVRLPKTCAGRRT